MLDLVADWLKKFEPTTLAVVVLIVHVRLGFRSLWALLVRIAKHLQVPTDDIKPPDAGVPEVIEEFENRATQPIAKPSEGAQVLGFKR